MAGTTPTYQRPRGMMGHMPPMPPEVHMKHILSQSEINKDNKIETFTERDHTSVSFLQLIACLRPLLLRRIETIFLFNFLCFIPEMCLLIDHEALLILSFRDYRSMCDFLVLY